MNIDGSNAILGTAFSHRIDVGRKGGSTSFKNKKGR